jgi:hypothetical protein
MKRHFSLTGTTRLIGATLAVIATAWTAAASAQEPAVSAPEGAPPPVTPTPVPPPPAPMPPPPVMQQSLPPPAPPPSGTSDLDPQERRVGIGYAGVSQIPVGGTAGTITAPAIGVRIWANQMLGIDVALGFGWAGGSSESGGIRTDQNATYGFIIQGGLPLALVTRRHVSFQVIPFAGSAYGHTSTPSMVGSPGANFNGTRVDVGVRSGFEIFWGFIGLPELSLSATVGAQFQMLKLTQDVYGIESSTTSYGLSTTVQNNPWDVFTGNVAARYYF